MAVFKCKMCGGALEVTDGMTVCECEYCGTKQTLPRLDDDRRANLYDRANHFRRNNEFDKAMGIYDQILNEDTADAEAYWSLVLCRYGIEYVEDPATHKRVPTVNRAQFTSIFDDDNYKSAIQYADSYQREVYEKEANAINEIQKGILAISQKEEPFDVFICYKETDNNGRRTQDSVLANDLYHQLTQEGFKVFFSRITLEDKLGTAYEPYIFAALNSAKVMVVLGTRPEYFNAVWVKNEWSRYLAIVKQSGGKKVLIPAYRDMDPYDLPDEFSHLQAQDMSKLGFMQDLIRGIKKIASAAESQTTVKETVVVSNNANIALLLKRAFMFLEDGEWEKAEDFCEQVLNQDPENAQAYIVKLMAELHIKKQENLADCKQPFDDNKHYQKAIRFGDEKLETEMRGYITHINERNFLKQKAGLTNVKAGSTIKFGFYEQDNNTSNGKEEIEWKVLAVEGNKALVISRYALDCQQYNSTFTDTTWEKCTLRTWINGTFYNAAFGPDHQKMIASSTVTADKNPSYGTSPGNNTTDKVFLLSITEVNKYFSSDSARQCSATAYAKAQGAFTDPSNGNCRWWWLRSPGVVSTLAAGVRNDGSVSNSGIGVGSVDSSGNRVTNSDDGAVRPALWIDLG